VVLAADDHRVDPVLPVDRLNLKEAPLVQILTGDMETLAGLCCGQPGLRVLTDQLVG